jgi:hypothetical protein
MIWDENLSKQPRSALLYGMLNEAHYNAPPHNIVLKEKITSDYAIVTLNSRHFFADVLNDKIVQLQESGIMAKFIKIWKPRKSSNDSDPVQLSLDHLLVWFKLWLGFILIAACFFFAEVLVKKAQKIMSHII